MMSSTISDSLQTNTILRNLTQKIKYISVSKIIDTPDKIFFKTLYNLLILLMMDKMIQFCFVSHMILYYESIEYCEKFRSFF